MAALILRIRARLFSAGWAFIIESPFFFRFVLVVMHREAYRLMASSSSRWTPSPMRCTRLAGNTGSACIASSFSFECLEWNGLMPAAPPLRRRTRWDGRVPLHPGPLECAAIHELLARAREPYLVGGRAGLLG